MQKKRLLVISTIVSIVLSQPAVVWSAIESQKAGAFAGQDLYLSGAELLSHQPKTGRYVLIFPKAFSMSFGPNEFSADAAVVWLNSVTTQFRGSTRIDYEAEVYLKGKVTVKKGKAARTVDLTQTLIKKGEAMVLRLLVKGEVFITAEKRQQVSDPAELEIYSEAAAALETVPTGPKFVIQPGARVPQLPGEKPKETVLVVAKEPGLLERIFAPKKKEPKPRKPTVPEEPGRVEPEPKEPTFVYPVNISPLGKEPLKLESAPQYDDMQVATVNQRFYLWQKQDERGSVLELQADNAVVYHKSKDLGPEKDQAATQDMLTSSSVRAIYMAGDVIMTEGLRTIRADEMYYDFEKRKALAINAVMSTFDPERGIPIYVRAAKLRQIAKYKFAAENVTLTSSEFYKPQIALTASSVIVTDTTDLDGLEGKISNDSYDAELRDIRLKLGETTIFYWPFMRSNLQRPDVPLKSIHAGYDSDWGATLETRWYLARLLGLKEPEGTESTYAFDYYSERGIGNGVDIKYSREKHFGRFLGYVIGDKGEDDLGRNRIRRNIDPDKDIRGRLHWLHRQFLPSDWQLTTELGWASDENFVEAFYRREFNMGRRETYLHLKRIKDNWGLSLLGKMRINDFQDVLEQLPQAEYHLTGQSLFDDRFTLYSDTNVGRLRQRIGDDHTIEIDQNWFTFAQHRTELDMPFQIAPLKVVPFIAGSYGYDDRSGFTRSLVDGSNTGHFGERSVFIGEVGLRLTPRAYWKVYPNVRSRLWDLNKLRHIIQPHFVGVLYQESDSVVEQRDTLDVGVSQRLQTKRGVGDKQRTVDWMRLDTDVVLVNNSESAGQSGADRFLWNRPLIPLRVFSAPQIFQGDLINSLHRFERWGPRRNYASADYVWRLSDTSAILSDINYDMQSDVVQQYNIGFMHLRWPNLSYYIGNRYLRRVNILDEQGSNAFTFAANYVLDPRYSIVFAQQYDFDYGANVRTDVTLVRRYHRVNCGLTFSADETLKRQSVSVSIWPEGVPELAIGERRYIGLGGAPAY